MTIDIEESQLRRPSPPAGEQRPGLLVRALACAPERLLLAFLWFCYIAAAAYVSGFFRPVVVLPATAVLVAITWRLFPRDRAVDPRSAIGSVLALATAGGWFAVNLPYIAERVQVTRDPDLYTLTALWLVDHASPDIPVPALSTGSLGFPLEDGALRPQGNHLVAGVSAAAGWLFGQEAIFWGNLACGAAALLAVYVLARRVVGSFWALVPMVALGASMPMLAFSRGLYSEPLALCFTCLGAALLWSAWKSDRRSEYLLAGASFGVVALSRIDGTLPLIGVLGGLAVAALVDPERPESGRRWAAPLVLLGSVPGVVLGFLDLYFHTGVYLHNLSGELLLLGDGLAVVAVLGVGLAFVRVPVNRLPGVRRIVAWLAVLGGVLVAVGLVVLITRPWWYVSHGGLDNGLVAAIQQREGLPVDGTRLYTEDSVKWLSWYYGWPAVAAGFAGLITWLVVGTRTRATQLLWLCALFLPSAVLYLTTPNITPDQIWAMRRFLPVVVPGLLLAATWVAGELSARGLFRRVTLGRVVAALLVFTIVAWPIVSMRHMWPAKDKAGALHGNERVCEQIDHRPTIVTGIDTYLPTVLVLCDVPAVSVPEPTAAKLAEAREALGGGTVVLATRAPGSVPWVDGTPPPPFTYRQKLWDASLAAPPDEQLGQEIGVTLGRVLPDGSVEPLD